MFMYLYVCVCYLQTCLYYCMLASFICCCLFVGMCWFCVGYVLVLYFGSLLFVLSLLVWCVVCLSIYDALLRDTSLSLYICIYTCIHTYILTWLYIYIYIFIHISLSIYVSLSLYIYIYIYITAVNKNDIIRFWPPGRQRDGPEEALGREVYFGLGSITITILMNNNNNKCTTTTTTTNNNNNTNIMTIAKLRPWGVSRAYVCRYLYFCLFNVFVVCFFCEPALSSPS